MVIINRFIVIVNCIDAFIASCQLLLCLFFITRLCKVLIYISPRFIVIFILCVVILIVFVGVVFIQRAYKLDISII